MKFTGPAWRAHDPRWSFQPLSGEGAAIHGGRFNPQGTPALYLALDMVTAVAENNQGFAFKIKPCVLCEYEIDCEDIVDLTREQDRGRHAIDLDRMGCGWLAVATAGKTPPSWAIAEALIKQGAAGAIVPSFAPGSIVGARNIVLWKWTDRPPHLCRVHDPDGRLPRDQTSWTG